MAEIIEKKLPPIERSFVEAFAKAIQTQSPSSVPPTLVTVYRHGEFEWLERLGILLKNVLHLEQEYEYLDEMRIGDAPQVRTWVAESKKRAGMEFVTLASEIGTGDRICVKSRTVFVVRESVGEKALK